MTERKPPGMSIEHWVDKQVREATEGGKFDDLPGAGKPIPPGGIGSEDDWWITQKMAREDLTFTAPTFEIRKAADRLPERVAKARTEDEVRALVGELNDRILEAIRKPMSGPPLNLMPRDTDRIVADWHEARARAQARLDAERAERLAEGGAESDRPRRRWLRRRRG